MCRSNVRRGLSLFAAAWWTLGCSTTRTSDTMVEPSGDLAPTMEVEIGEGDVTLWLHVTNISDRPVELEFGSGQRYDFMVTSAAGDTLWTWSVGKSFLQALGTETLAPGESLRYGVTWPARGQSGHFIGSGQVTATNEPVRQSVRFEL